ncbi:MAG: hypothetical protein HY401_04205 [Elusimicrobia bacterium]|nr:hypothetical protein [Elusimicrobiota bacterium]
MNLKEARRLLEKKLIGLGFDESSAQKAAHGFEQEYEGQEVFFAERWIIWKARVIAQLKFMGGKHGMD